MAGVQILGQRCPHGGKMLIRGVFTQKIKLWKEMEKLFDVESLMIKDDFSDKTVSCNYNRVLKILREVGRATLTEDDGSVVFQIVDAETNQLRDWDVDENGEPRCNPVTR